MTEAEYIAMHFHALYEELAPLYQYTTRPESAVDWSEVPENNKKLMIAVAEELLAQGVIRFAG